MTSRDENTHVKKVSIASIVLMGAAILVVAAAYAVTAMSSRPRLYLAPAAITAASGATMTVAVREDSRSTSVNAVQADISYNPAQLQYVGSSGTGSAFGIQAQSSGSNGHVVIARAVEGDMSGVSGDQFVATLTFRVVPGSGSGQLHFMAGSVLVRSHGNTALPLRFTSTTVRFKSGPTMSASAPMSSSTPASTGAVAASGTGTIYIQPSSGSVASGSDVTLEIHENSGTVPVNAVQADYSYSTSQFQFVSMSGSNSAFGLQAQAAGGNGSIVIVRGITPGSAPLTGDRVVATVTLKALGSGSATIRAASGSVLMRSNGNSNILNNVTGGSFQIQ